MFKTILLVIVIILGTITYCANTYILFNLYGMINTGYYRYTVKYRYNKDKSIHYINSEELLNDSLIIIDKQLINKE